MVVEKIPTTVERESHDFHKDGGEGESEKPKRREERRPELHCRQNSRSEVQRCRRRRWRRRRRRRRRRRSRRVQLVQQQLQWRRCSSVELVVPL